MFARWKIGNLTYIVRYNHVVNIPHRHRNRIVDYATIEYRIGRWYNERAERITLFYIGQ